jgi:DNA-binding YbaB/EbfC family protein
MQEKMQSAQADLADKTVTATAGGGKVTVVASGGGDVLSIKISKEVVDPEDVEMLEDLILTGVQKALAEAKELAASEMGKVTAGLGLPPGMGF